MKKVIVFGVLLCLAGSIHAQKFVLGLKAGVNRGSMSTKFSGFSEEANYGFVAGVYSRFGILGFFAQPEFQFNQRRGTLTGNNSEANQTLSYIDVPLLVGKKFLKITRFYAGPNLQFLMNASQSGINDPNFNKSNFNNFAVGGILGCGVDILKVSVDLRYDFSITNLGKEITVGGNKFDYSTRAGMWQLTVGYKLLDL